MTFLASRQAVEPLCSSQRLRSKEIMRCFGFLRQFVILSLIVSKV